jgi:outer membrane protein assembly factor BamB
VRRLVIAAVCLVLGIGLAGPAAAAQKPSDATNYQVGATHTGYAPGPALSNKMRRLWTKDFGPATSYPLIVGNRVFVAGKLKQASVEEPLRVFAFDKRSGRQLWKSPAIGDDDSKATLAYGSGRLVALKDDWEVNGATHAQLQALSPASGKVLWKKKLAAPTYHMIVHSADTPVTVRAGVAYVNFSYSGDNYMAVDVLTGKTKWAKYGMDGAMGQAVTSNRVYYSSSCVWAARTLGGKLVWSDDFRCSGAGGDDTAVVDGKRMWMHTHWNASWVVDARNGKLLFQFDSNSVPAIVGKKAFVTPEGTSRWDVLIRAVDSSTGAKLWTRRPAAKYGQIIGPPVATSKVVYVTTSYGWVLGYSTATGKLVWTGKAGGTINPDLDGLINEGSAIGGGVLATTVTNRLAVFG